MTEIATYPLRYGTFVYEPAFTFRFGPLGAPLLTLNAPDAEGCVWVCDEPEGWAAPEAQTPLDARAEGDGGYAGETTYAPRTLTFGGTDTGVCVAPDRPAAQAALRRLRQVAQTRDPVLYTQPGEDGDESLWLRSSGQPKVRWFAAGLGFQFSLVMVAEDPLKFDAAQLAQPLTAGLPVTTGGYRYPVVGNKVYGVGSALGGSLVVTNRGDEDSPAVYTLQGPLTAPTVANATTGDYFTVNRSWGPLDTVVVDTAAGTVLLGGTSIYGDLLGGFPSVVPGDNRFQWSHQAAWNGAASLSVATTSTRK